MKKERDIFRVIVDELWPLISVVAVIMLLYFNERELDACFNYNLNNHSLLFSSLSKSKSLLLTCSNLNTAETDWN